MGDHPECFTTRVWDVGVSRRSGRAVWLMHEEPRGSGDVSPLRTLFVPRTATRTGEVIRVNLVCLSPINRLRAVFYCGHYSSYSLSACGNVISPVLIEIMSMNSVVLILRNEKPQLIQVAEGMNSISLHQEDGTERELEIMNAVVRSLTGDNSSYLIATDIEDLDSAQIRRAIEIIYN